jgi:exopolyphosphatase/guanosine-5'-triphosphate,3'-diphosphate pyrophosphatase
MLDRELPETDLRTSTVQGLVQSFAVDRDQARRVAAVAGQLFAQALPDHQGTGARKLGWAAQLHEIGCRISHSDYHRHGAYILDNTDVAGFAQHELHRLGALVLGHRGKVRKIEADLGDTLFAAQLLCLRLAVILCHARRDPDLQGLALGLEDSRFTLSARASWAASYPQSAYLLREEMEAWQRTGWELSVLLP